MLAYRSKGPDVEKSELREKNERRNIRGVGWDHIKKIF